MAASDKLATAELTIAKDQLKSLHGTVMKINQERAEVSPHVQNKFPPVLLLLSKHITCIIDLLKDFGYFLNHYKVVCFPFGPEDCISPITALPWVLHSIGS